MAVGGDGAGIAGGQALVLERIAAVDALGRPKEADELGAHEVVALLEIGRIAAVDIGALAHQVRQVAHAFGRQRVGLQVGIDAARGDQHLVGEALERFEEPGGRLPRGVEELDGGAVGSRFLGALVGEDVALGDLAAAGDRHRAEIAEALDAGRRAGDRGAHADEGGDHGSGAGMGDRLADAGEIAMGEVAGLVRDDADQLVGRLGIDDRAGGHEHIGRGRDEGVEVVVRDKKDLHAADADARGLEDRLGIVLDEGFGLGVAGDVDAVGVARPGGEDDCGGDLQGGCRADQPVPAAPRPFPIRRSPARHNWLTHPSLPRSCARGLSASIASTLGTGCRTVNATAALDAMARWRRIGAAPRRNAGSRNR